MDRSFSSRSGAFLFLLSVLRTLLNVFRPHSQTLTEIVALSLDLVSCGRRCYFQSFIESNSAFRTRVTLEWQCNIFGKSNYVWGWPSGAEKCCKTVCIRRHCISTVKTLIHWRCGPKMDEVCGYACHPVLIKGTYVFRPVVFNLGYAKTSYGVCKIEKKIFRDKLWTVRASLATWDSDVRTYHPHTSWSPGANPNSSPDYSVFIPKYKIFNHIILLS
jgi:hypothetical protein